MHNSLQPQFVDIEGLSIRYYQAGTKGLPLVLLHGTGDSALDWSWVLPMLASNYCVYVPDLPGHGESAKPIRDYSLSFFTEFVIKFLDALKLTTVVMVGNSLGGLISLQVALTDQKRVAALVLADSTGLGQWANPLLCGLTLPIYGESAVIAGKTPLGAKLRARSRSILLFAHPERIPQEWYLEQEHIAQIPGFMEADLSALRTQLNLFGQRIILLDMLPQLSMPILLVWGIKDLIVPKTQAEIALRYLKQGQIALIPDCGHVCPLEQPDAFVSALDKFLTQQGL
ncbi:alpha/beta hydrolase fold protein [Gloeothece citriformis PCC 7424]|uniref:Alpha/beta hydrolase fold protein n=1 Tax=Gloeothece citriformis (strain PCC 7424) TaxID=65393 RepID=B7K9W4_GLOC7|nr:alpha/beta fold hydrolase [Gloeothece citriformis]ACK71320.1 alpha/beta hydrolase fold protein [Gloeothece citriformis PCC 7424]